MKAGNLQLILCSLLALMLFSGTGYSAVTWVYPTPNNGATVYADHVYLNTTISNAVNIPAFFDWNRSLRVYYTFEHYDSAGVSDNSTYGNKGLFSAASGTCSGTHYDCSTYEDGTTCFAHGCTWLPMYPTVCYGTPHACSADTTQASCIEGGCTWTPDSGGSHMTTGKFGNAMSFDGVNDYLYWGYNKPANDFTIAFWFKA
ncbi:MAG: hypothetical protein HZB67_04810, partial [Candidatus Aenigmarchaeota archaeon]|nr:hypothetical protein [Candidatus Aenigmarchaeota archaeon]